MLPLVIGIWSIPGEAGWSDDVAIVRDLGFVPVGSEGVLSTLLTQLAALVPLGGRLLRANLLGVIALSLCSRLLFASIRDLLERQAPSRLAPFLALLASQLWALGPAVQSEAARVGGAAVPLALILIGTRLASELGDARAAPVAGLLLGVAAAESHTAGLILALVFLLPGVDGRRSPSPSGSLRFGAALVASSALCASVHWLRALSPAAWAQLGMTVPEGVDVSAEVVAIEGVADFARQAAEPFRAGLGVVPLLLSLAGLAWALQAGTPLRRALLPWALFAGSGVLVPFARAAGLSAGAGLLSLLSGLGCAAFFPLALSALVRWLWSCPLPFARPAGVLSVTFAATLVVSRADQTVAFEGAPIAGAELWTEEALGKLPLGSLALVRSPALAFRLMSARVLQGTRPDVVIVPAALLSSGSVTAQLVQADPSLSPLLRQLWVNGFADEYALSRLADARPVFVELDPNWEARVLEHLRPDAMWLGFSSHALGASDRHAGVERSRAALRRVLEPLEAEGSVDAGTRKVLARIGAQQALAMAALGDRDASRRLLRVVRHLDPRDPLARELVMRLGQPRRGRVAVNDLVR